jgi:hypothetical protein
MSQAGRYAAELPLDNDFEIRVHATRRFWRVLNGRPAGPAFHEPPPQCRQRLALAVRALDGRIEGNSYRAIAEGLFGAKHIPEWAWKAHDLRNRTIRLVQSGFALMRGGYREPRRQSRRKKSLVVPEGYRKSTPDLRHPPSRVGSAIVTPDAPPTSPVLHDLTEPLKCPIRTPVCRRDTCARPKPPDS